MNNTTTKVNKDCYVCGGKVAKGSHFCPTPKSASICSEDGCRLSWHLSKVGSKFPSCEIGFNENPKEENGYICFDDGTLHITWKGIRYCFWKGEAYSDSKIEKLEAWGKEKALPYIKSITKK